jgi:hypothetical protein
MALRFWFHKDVGALMHVPLGAFTLLKTSADPVSAMPLTENLYWTMRSR